MTPTATPHRSMAHSMGRSADKRNSRSSILLLVGLFLLGLVIISQLGENGIVSWLNLQAKVQKLEKNTAKLELQNKDLETRIDAVTNDPQTLEIIAREKFNMKRSNEEVLMVLPLPQTPQDDHSTLGDKAGR